MSLAEYWCAIGELVQSLALQTLVPVTDCLFVIGELVESPTLLRLVTAAECLLEITELEQH